MKTARAPVVAVAVGAALVVAAFAVPRLGLGIAQTDTTVEALRRIFTGVGPIFGSYAPHVGPGSIPAIVIGVAAVVWGPTLAGRLPWRGLPWATWATSCAWAFSLAMVDGWRRGFTDRLTTRAEYLHQVPTIGDIPATLRTFADRIEDFHPDSWITHVSGHPPGALLTFVWLDRVGLGGGVWAGLWCLVIGSGAAAAIVVAVHCLADEATARRAAPFVAVAPTAIWIAVSADGYFAGVAAWGLALLALAVRCQLRAPALTAAGAGVLLGWALYLNYGLALLALPAAAVIAGADGWRPALRVVAPAALAVAAVIAAFTAAGFWWFDGYVAVQHRYWQGVAQIRPFSYWAWANLASGVCAIGLGSVAGICRVFDIAALRRRAGLPLLLAAMLAVIAAADASMLSKAETERIWLPFTVWLTAAPALLPVRSHRVLLAVNVAGALAINHLVFTVW